ncbi:MAG: hypothetical protein R2741_11235 [Methanolobus sp.]
MTTAFVVVEPESIPAVRPLCFSLARRCLRLAIVVELPYVSAV